MNSGTYNRSTLASVLLNLTSIPVNAADRKVYLQTVGVHFPPPNIPTPQIPSLLRNDED